VRGIKSRKKLPCSSLSHVLNLPTHRPENMEERKVLGMTERGERGGVKRLPPTLIDSHYTRVIGIPGAHTVIMTADPLPERRGC